MHPLNRYKMGAPRKDLIGRTLQKNASITMKETFAKACFVWHGGHLKKTISNRNMFNSSHTAVTINEYMKK